MNFELKQLYWCQFPAHSGHIVLTLSGRNIPGFICQKSLEGIYWGSYKLLESHRSLLFWLSYSCCQMAKKMSLGIKIPCTIKSAGGWHKVATTGLQYNEHVIVPGVSGQEYCLCHIDAVCNAYALSFLQYFLNPLIKYCQVWQKAGSFKFPTVLMNKCG